MQQTISEDLSLCPNVEQILKKHQIGYWQNPGGTDKQKCENVGSPGDSHSYGPIYEFLLSRIKTKQKSCILEIGVQHGGSMLLWHDFCPNAFVIGIDVMDCVHDKIKNNLKQDRHAFLIQDAYSAQTINKIKTLVLDGIDLIIDDGPHSLESQCSFLNLYLPLLSKTGVAVIEDIQELSWFKVLEDALPPGYTSERIDRRHVNGRWDDLMLVIERNLQ
jgi:hypothetical protein